MWTRRVGNYIKWCISSQAWGAYENLERAPEKSHTLCEEHIKRKRPIGECAQNGKGLSGWLRLFAVGEKKLSGVLESPQPSAAATLPGDPRPQPPNTQSNTWCFCVNLVLLRASASKAAASAEIKVFRKSKGANVSGHVKSQKRGHPFVQGIRVALSGFFPSPLIKPGGLRMDGTWTRRNAHIYTYRLRRLIYIKKTLTWFQYQGHSSLVLRQARMAWDHSTSRTWYRNLVLLISALVILINHVLSQGVPQPVRLVFFGAYLHALLKKDRGLRPIPIGLTFWRLYKIASRWGSAWMSPLLAPRQLGVGVSGRAETTFWVQKKESSKVMRWVPPYVQKLCHFHICDLTVAYLADVTLEYFIDSLGGEDMDFQRRASSIGLTINVR